MKFKNTEVCGFDYVVHFLLPLRENGVLSDSKWKGLCSVDNEWVDESCSYDACLQCCEKIREFFVGPNDLEVMRKLIKSDADSQKFMDKILVTVEITAPMYWWSVYNNTLSSTYAVTQEPFSKPITIDCFEMGDFEVVGISCISQYVETTIDWWDYVINACEELRQKYLETKDKRYLKELIRLLPESWLQTRKVTLSYEDILCLINQNNQSTEQSDVFMNWAKSLPYADRLLF